MIAYCTQCLAVDPADAGDGYSRCCQAEIADEPLYPHVYVPLLGEDGNAFHIIGRVRRAMRDANVPVAERDRYSEFAMSGRWPHAIDATRIFVKTNIDWEGYFE